VPCIAIAGSVGDDLGDLHSVGLDAVFSLTPGPLTLKQSIADAAALIEKSTEQALRCFLAGRTLGGHDR
jgi:glycerate kinase